MSVVALRGIRDLRLPPTQKLILFALADMANDYGEAWPLMNTLRNVTGLSERAIQASIKVLEVAQHVRVSRSFGRSSRYFLNMQTPAGDAPHPAGDAGVNGNTHPAAGAPHTPQQVRDTPAAGAPRSGSKKERKNLSSEKDLLDDIPPPSGIVERAISIWNTVCGAACGKVLKATPARGQRLRIVLRDEFKNDRQKWEAFCQRVNRSPFLSGKNERAWAADFDWVLKPANFVKIIEGRYDDREANGHHVNGERRKTVDRRYFSGTAEQVCALPEPPWSTQERAAWLDARMTGYVANIPEGYNAV